MSFRLSQAVYRMGKSDDSVLLAYSDTAKVITLRRASLREAVRRGFLELDKAGFTRPESGFEAGASYCLRKARAGNGSESGLGDAANDTASSTSASFELTPAPVPTFPELLLLEMRLQLFAESRDKYATPQGMSLMAAALEDVRLLPILRAATAPSHPAFLAGQRSIDVASKAVILAHELMEAQLTAASVSATQTPWEIAAQTSRSTLEGLEAACGSFVRLYAMVNAPLENMISLLTEMEGGDVSPLGHLRPNEALRCKIQLALLAWSAMPCGGDFEDGKGFPNTATTLSDLAELLSAEEMPAVAEKPDALVSYLLDKVGARRIRPSDADTFWIRWSAAQASIHSLAASISQHDDDTPTNLNASEIAMLRRGLCALAAAFQLVSWADSTKTDNQSGFDSLLPTGRTVAIVLRGLCASVFGLQGASAAFLVRSVDGKDWREEVPVCAALVGALMYLSNAGAVAGITEETVSQIVSEPPVEATQAPVALDDLAAQMQLLLSSMGATA
jgi:hypothetical protein